MLGVDEFLDGGVALLNGLDQLLDDHHKDLEDLIVQVTLLPLRYCNAIERLPKTHVINNTAGLEKWDWMVVWQEWKMWSDEAKWLVGRTGGFDAFEEGELAVELADRVIALVLADWQSEAGAGAAFGAEVDEHVAVLKQPLLYLVFFLRSSRGVEPQDAREHVPVGILLRHYFASSRP